VSEADVARFRAFRRGDVDLLVTHTPPAEVTEAMTRRPAHPSAVRVQAVWEHLGRPDLACGHMHEAYEYENVFVPPMLGLAVR
jgi:hypothetical protein